MILRAMFFIAAVALLAPREPDLGLGRPSTNVEMPDVAALAQGCNQGACSLNTGAFPAVKARVIANLIKVKADIAEAQRERAIYGD